MDRQFEKTKIRHEVVARILAMDPKDRQTQESALSRRFGELPGLAEARTVLLYASAFPEEVETRPFLLQALELGKRLVLPKVDRLTRSLRLFEVADLTLDLQAGHRGIPEPSSRCVEVAPLEVDWVLVPGLAFTSRGFRLGRGAGHYDKLLPRLRDDASRWALIFETQWYENLPLEPHDQPIDGLADCRRVVRFSR